MELTLEEVIKLRNKINNWGERYNGILFYEGSLEDVYMKISRTSFFRTYYLEITSQSHRLNIPIAVYSSKEHPEVKESFEYVKTKLRKETQKEEAFEYIRTLLKKK